MAPAAYRSGVLSVPYTRACRSICRPIGLQGVQLENNFAQFIAATRGRKVDCLAHRDQTWCSISSILRRWAGRSRPDLGNILVTRVPLPPRSSNLNAYTVRWVRSVKEECLSRFILFGEAALYHALRTSLAYYQHERNHQGQGSVFLFPMISHNAKGGMEPTTEHCMLWRDKQSPLTPIRLPGTLHAMACWQASAEERDEPSCNILRPLVLTCLRPS
jgi:hypothetical protein